MSSWPPKAGPAAQLSPNPTKCIGRLQLSLKPSPQKWPFWLMSHFPIIIHIKYAMFNSLYIHKDELYR